MTTYVYYCKHCDVDINHKEPMLEGKHDKLVCPLCGKIAYRVYLSNIKAMDINGYAGARTNASTPRYERMKRDKREIDADDNSISTG